MYPVDQDLYNQTKADVQVPHLRGWIEDTIAFTENNILRDTFSINAQCTESTKISIGTVYTKTLKMTLCHGVANYRRQWKGKKIVIEQGIEVPRLNDTPVVKWIPMGTFYASEGVWTPKGINIKAYDDMMKFNKAIDFTQTTGQAYDILLMLCASCGVTLGMSIEQVAALPNGLRPLGITNVDGTPKYRDVLASLAAALGGFAEIYRDGKLYIRNYHTTPDDSITIYERFNPSFSDFTSYFSEITVTNDDGTVDSYIASQVQNGLTMDLKNNQFLQLGVSTTIAAERQEVADAVGNISYTPFNATVLTSFYYDLSDVLSFPEGIADDCTGCAMAITYSFTKTMIVGYGDDPALQETSTAIDKALSKLSRSNKEEVVTHVYKNAVAYGLQDQTEVPVVDIFFATVSPKTVKTFTEVNLDLTITDASGVASCTAYYYLNGVLETYHPVATWNNDGKHILSLMYPLETLAGSSTYEWEVRLEVEGGSATIAIGDVHCLLEGQGLVAVDEFNGTIKCTDEFEAIYLGQNVVSLIDTFDLTTEGQGETYYRLTEDGDVRIVEDGDFRITEEGQ